MSVARRDHAPAGLLRALAAEGPVPVSVRGLSMGGALADGTRLQIHDRRPLPGDVVVFRSGGGPLLAHRLLGLYRRRGEWHLVTRGDAADRADPPVRETALVGVADVTVPLRTRLLSIASFLRWAVRAGAARLT